MLVETIKIVGFRKFSAVIGLSLIITLIGITADPTLALSPNGAAEQRSSIKAHTTFASVIDPNLCSPSSASLLQQVPACKTFAPLTNGSNGLSTGDEPLPYQQNTANSSFAVSGGSVGGTWSVTSFTPDVCSNARYIDLSHPVKPNIAYFQFQSGAKGMCRISVSHTGGTPNQNETTQVDFPVESWNLSVVTPPRTFGAIYQGNINTGSEVGVPLPRFIYPGTNFDVDQVAPTFLSITTPQTCDWAPDRKLKAVSDGDCMLTFNWLSFAFGSRNYPAGSSSFKAFTVTTPLTSSQLANKKADSIAKAKADKAATLAAIKLCPLVNQNALRTTYAPLTSLNNQYSTLYGLLSRANYLANSTSSDTSIQIPADAYSIVLQYYPSINGVRQVPLHTYVAVLNGAMMGLSKVRNLALAKANSTYLKASVGCRRVVGPPK